MFNIIATVDIGNCDAKADIVVDGTLITSNVPVTHVLFLEKQLTDLHTFISKFPTLDPSEVWTWNDAAGCYKSEPRQTVKSKKIPRNHVLDPGNEHHPAQVQIYNEDKVVGNWTQIRLSGNIKQSDKDALLEKVRDLDKAVKFAREEANSIEVTKSDIGDKILNYIFGK